MKNENSRFHFISFLLAYFFFHSFSFWPFLFHPLVFFHSFSFHFILLFSSSHFHIFISFPQFISFSHFHFIRLFDFGTIFQRLFADHILCLASRLQMSEDFVGTRDGATQPALFLRINVREE